MALRFTKFHISHEIKNNISVQNQKNTLQSLTWNADFINSDLFFTQNVN